MSKLAEWWDFTQECYTELQKVTWPDRAQVMNATWVIIAFVILVSAVIWIMDRTSSLVIDSIMALFGAG